MTFLGLVVAVTLTAGPAAVPSANGNAGPLSAVRAMQASALMAESDSLCRIAVSELSRPPIRDSLLLAEAWTRLSRARLAREVYDDSTGVAAADKAWDIRRRLRDPDADDAAQIRMLRMNWRILQGRGELVEPMLVDVFESRLRYAAPVDTILPEVMRAFGFLRRDRGQLAGAVSAFDSSRALRIRSRGAEDVPGLLMLGEIGRLLRLQGALEPARDTLTRAIAELEKREGPNSLSSGGLLDYLAATERDAGNLLRAIDLSNEAVRRMRTAPTPRGTEIARVRRNMAGWMLELDDLHGAIAILEESLPVYQRMYGPKHWRVAGVHGSLASALLTLGDSTGLAHLREADAIRRARSGPPDPELTRVRHTEGSWWFRQGRFLEAADAAERGIAVAAQNPSPVRVAMGQLHVLRVVSRAWAADSTGLALACADLARFAADQGLDSSSVNDEVHLALSFAYETQGRNADAWNEARLAQSIAHERASRSAHALSDQHALLRRADGLAALDRVFQLARRDPAQRLEVAWDRLVRGRGIVRAELQRRRPPAELQSDTAVVASLERWNDAQRRLARVSLALGATRGGAGRAEYERARAEANERERLHAILLGSRGLRAPAGEVSLAEVRESLAPGEALVSLVELHAASDTARMIALVARAGAAAVTHVDLGSSASLERDLATWRAELSRWPATTRQGAAAAERACRQAGERVRRRTWDRLASVLQDAREVWLVGDGPLTSTPWHALPTSAGRWLVETGPVLHLPLAERDLLERSDARGGARIGEPGRFLAIGAPRFGEAGAPRRDAARGEPCGDGIAQLDSLPSARAEVRDVAGDWTRRGATGMTLLDAEATEAAFRAHAPGAGVLHIATHGVVTGDDCAELAPGLRGVGGVGPLTAGAPAPAASARRKPQAPAPASRTPVSPWAFRRTWLALASASASGPSSADREDGRLTAEEVVTLDMSRAKWVVLSACRSGASDNWPGEGALGMRRAFALAGARAVIASEWAVEDAATREWMTALHRALAGGTGTAQGMSTASREVLRARRAAGRSTHPFYWAAFTASGD